MSTQTLIHITEQALCYQHAQQQVVEQQKDDGAIVSFLGLAREMTTNGQLQEMHLEHYPGMTESSLNTLVLTARKQWQLGVISIIHRVGKILPHEPIVFVAVSARHRGDAFLACEYLMDTLKSSSPLWKKEVTDQGAYWLEAKQSDKDRAAKWDD